MLSSCFFGNFPLPTTKNRTMPHPHAITRFANILSAYSCSNLFAQKRTSVVDFRTLHISPFIVDLAPMASLVALCLDVCTVFSSKYQEKHQVWCSANCACYSVRLSLHIGTLSVHHHPLGSSWETGCHYAHEQNTFCFYQTLLISPLLVQPVVSVCACEEGWGVGTLCSWL